jgi:hypothetical protein
MTTDNTKHVRTAFAEAFASMRDRVAPEATMGPRAIKEAVWRSRAGSKPIAPGVARRAAAFLARHPWYAGPYSLDAESMVVTTLDNILSDVEGHDPDTDAYWTELETRARVFLPHRQTLTPTHP